MTYPDPPWREPDGGSLGRPSRDTAGFWQYATWNPNTMQVIQYTSRQHALAEVEQGEPGVMLIRRWMGGWRLAPPDEDRSE